MRLASVLLLPIGLMSLIACNPPNPENEAPNIQLLSPAGVYDRESTDTTYSAGADAPFDMEFRLRDRDGDSPLSIVLYFDPTPDNADNDDLVEIASAADLVPVITTIPVDLDDPEGNQFDDLIVDVALTVTDGLPEGRQVLVARAADGTGIGDPREARYDFQVNAAISAPQVAIAPAAPTAQDPLSGALSAPSVDPEGGQPFHVWRWTRVDPADPVVQLPPDNPGTNFPAALPAVQTARGDTWEFCVTAYESQDGNPPADFDAVQSQTTCDTVTIGNAAPGAPGGVEVLPERPTAGGPLFCDVAIDATDPDGDPVRYQYDWSLDGTPVITGSLDAWLSPAELSGGGSWTCTATAVDSSDGTDLLGGALESAGVSVADASIGIGARASRTLDGSLNAQLGTNVALAPIETFNSVTLFPQECLVVGLPDGLSAQGLVRSYRGSVLQMANPETSATGDAGAEIGGPLAVGPVEGSGNNDLVVGGIGQIWVVFSDSLAPTGTAHPLSSGSLDVQQVVSTDLGFGSALAVGDIFPLSAGGELVISTNDPTAFNTVRVIDGADFGRSAADIDLDLSAPATTLSADNLVDSFGDVVYAEADLTGDAIADLVVSDPGTAVYVFAGGNGLAGNLITSDAAFTVTGGGGIGSAVTSADVDGDGAADLIISAPTSGAGGEVAVFLAATVAGNTTLPFSSADYILRGSSGSSFGLGLSVVPDPSGLFGDTLVVGAPDEDDGAVLDVGMVYLFTSEDVLGAATPLAIPNGDASVRYVGELAGGRLTVRANPADLDNDGFDDLVLSAPQYSPTVGSLLGRVYVDLTTAF